MYGPSMCLVLLCFPPHSRLGVFFHFSGGGRRFPRIYLVSLILGLLTLSQGASQSPRSPSLLPASYPGVHSKCATPHLVTVSPKTGDDGDIGT